MNYDGCPLFHSKNSFRSLVEKLGLDSLQKHSGEPRGYRDLQILSDGSNSLFASHCRCGIAASGELSVMVGFNYRLLLEVVLDGTALIQYKGIYSVSSAE